MSTNSTSINIKSTAAEKVATSEKIMMVIADRIKKLIRQKNVKNNRTDGRPYYFTTNIDTAVYGRWFTILAIYNDKENPEIRRFHVDAFQSFTSEDDRSQRGMFQIGSNNPGDVSLSEFSPYFIRKVSERLPSEDNLEQMTDEELAKFLSKFTSSGVVNVGETIVLFLIENYRNSFKFQNDFRADRHVRICNTIMRVRRDDYLFTLTASC